MMRLSGARKLLLATTFLAGFALPQVADADPISMAVAATASSVISAGGFAAIGTMSFLGLSGLGAVFAQFAVRAALGYALNALTPKPSSLSSGYPITVNAISPAASHAVIYGEARVGGAVFYQAVTGASNEYLHRCIAFAGHEIDSYQSFYLNDEELTLDGSGNVTAPAQYVGYVRIKSKLGTSTQAADSDLVSEVTEWTTSHQAKGVAYAYVRYTYNATAFPNGIPTLTAVIRGKEVYDPRTDTTAWSDNPALCIRDYVASDYGLNAASTEIDDDAYSTAADVCDEDPGDGLKRFTCNGAFTLDSEPNAVVSAMLSSMGGMFWFAQGLWKVRAANYTTPTIEFDESDLRGDVNIATRNSRRQNFNTVRGTYKGEETNWSESDFTEVTNASYVTEDGGEENAIDMQLAFTNTDAMAQRIATIALKRNREQVTITAPFGLKALQVGIGDTIMLTNTRLGYTQKVFEVNDWRFGLTDDLDLQVNMMVREISSDVFT